MNLFFVLSGNKITWIWHFLKWTVSHRLDLLWKWYQWLRPTEDIWQWTLKICRCPINFWQVFKVLKQPTLHAYQTTFPLGWRLVSPLTISQFPFPLSSIFASSCTNQNMLLCPVSSCSRRCSRCNAKLLVLHFLHPSGKKESCKCGYDKIAVKVISLLQLELLLFPLNTSRLLKKADCYAFSVGCLRTSKAY